MCFRGGVHMWYTPILDGSLGHPSTRCDLRRVLDHERLFTIFAGENFLCIYNVLTRHHQNLSWSWGSGWGGFRLDKGSKGEGNEIAAQLCLKSWLAVIIIRCNTDLTVSMLISSAPFTSLKLLLVLAFLSSRHKPSTFACWEGWGWALTTWVLKLERLTIHVNIS